MTTAHQHSIPKQVRNFHQRRRSSIHPTLILLTILVGSTVLAVTPQTLNTDVIPVPHPNAYGRVGGGCVPYNQLPTPVRHPDGSITIFYNDGRWKMGNILTECETLEEVVATRFTDSTISRVPIHTATFDPYLVWDPVAGKYNYDHPDCAPRRYPICNPPITDGSPCSSCSDTPWCTGTWTPPCDECSDQYSDQPPYEHTTHENGMPSAIFLNNEWKIVFGRTNWESFKCASWACNIEGYEVYPGALEYKALSPSCSTNKCIRRTRRQIAYLHGTYPTTPFSMERTGNLGFPYCPNPGCCLGDGVLPVALVVKPGSNSRAYVFASAKFVDVDQNGNPIENIHSGRYRMELENGALSGPYTKTSGLPNHYFDDVAWSYVDGEPVFFAITNDTNYAFVWVSYDEGISWSPYMSAGQQLKYGPGGGAIITASFLHNEDGTLAAPFTVEWDAQYDHDGDPNTPARFDMYLQSADPAALPDSITKRLLVDDFERGQLSLWEFVSPQDGTFDRPVSEPTER